MFKITLNNSNSKLAARSVGVGSSQFVGRVEARAGGGNLYLQIQKSNVGCERGQLLNYFFLQHRASVDRSSCRVASVGRHRRVEEKHKKE